MGTHSDGCRAELNGFEGVFDLEEAAFGGEGAGWSFSGDRKAIVGTFPYFMPRSRDISFERASLWSSGELTVLRPRDEHGGLVVGALLNWKGDSNRQPNV